MKPNTNAFFSSKGPFAAGSFDAFNFRSSKTSLDEVLFITSYPPRECGIASYSQDLIVALNTKFKNSFRISIAALEFSCDKFQYSDDVDYILETDNKNSYEQLAAQINLNKNIKTVIIQHEFGLFRANETDFIHFLKALRKPIIMAFHTVLPSPNETLKAMVQEFNKVVSAFVVMTHSAARILDIHYDFDQRKITVIPHGTHLVEHSNKKKLKEKYHLLGRKVISTFGLLSSGKSIETSIVALQTIVKTEPNVLFLIIGKTHPTVFQNEGETYRESLEAIISDLKLQKNVKFINKYLPLDELLEYLQLTDIYLFTSKDRNQAVSGTFSYAMSCGCPIISTPIPHAREVLEDGTGIIVDFENPDQLAEQVIRLLNDEQLCKTISANSIHKLAPTAWDNSALAHALLFTKWNSKLVLQYTIPEINLNHFKNLTTEFGIIQFANINQPDLASGYTLDDNARALIAICQHYELTNDPSDVAYIHLYYEFIKYCLQTEGYFLNYVDENKNFTKQNNENLSDANGRAIWALGYLISIDTALDVEFIRDVKISMNKALLYAPKIHSPRAMAFIIKGIYYSNLKINSIYKTLMIEELCDRLVQMYRHESKPDWDWFESYLTYGNSILSEALLYGYLETGNATYKKIAIVSFDFLLTKIFNENRIKVISNNGWLHYRTANFAAKIGGEQPIDVAYTITTLSAFYETFKEVGYLQKMELAFSWFLGNNHLNKIIYNPCTGGCYDGLEHDYINLNQGAESTVSYLMARLKTEKYFNTKRVKTRVKTKEFQSKYQPQFISI